MKRLLLITISGFLLMSCFKSDNRDLGVYNTADGYIRYQLHGFPFEMNGGYNSFSTTDTGVYARKQLKSATIPATRYVIIGQLSARKSINIIIVTDSLKSGSYTTGSTDNGITIAKFDTVDYSANRSQDVLNLNITRNISGTIEGTFSGKLSVAKTINGTTVFTEAFISNGFFQNVAISY